MTRAKPIRTRFASETREFAPIAAINMTPLIDMMLVILIMLIICIPLSTHNIAVDVPPPAPAPAAPPPVHTLAIDAGGTLSWNGRMLPAAALPGRLAALRADPAQPVLQLAAAAEARYERFDEVLGAVRTAGITRLGFVGNHNYAGSLDR